MRRVSSQSDKPYGRSGSDGLAWLALILVLALAATGVWLLFQLQQRESDVLQRLQSVEAVVGGEASDLEQVRKNLERQLRPELAAANNALRGEWQREVEQLRERYRELAASADEALRLQQDGARRLALLQRELESVQERLGEEVAVLAGQVARQRARVEQISADDRDSWLLAEIQYLLRLANQRLVMAGDTQAALALMRSADGILQQLDDVGLLDVRRALASDMAAVRAVPRLDIEGTYLRLGALIEQAAALLVHELPEREGEPVTDASGGWRERLDHGYARALQKLSDYVVFRRRDVPVEALMDPQWESIVRQNMRMLLEQSQAAVLSGNQRLFRESLQRAGLWVEQFFDGDEGLAGSVIRELEDLAATRISVDVPDVSQTLQALQAAIGRRVSGSSEQ